MSMHVQLSVIMPVYNASKYVNEAIQSILKQTFLDFELIILNDCSTDNSLEIIKKNQAEDERIIIIDKNYNSGPSYLRNEGFKLAKGEFIALMDADDISINTRFEKQIALLKKNPEIGVCGSWFKIFGNNKNEEIIKHYEYHEKIKVKFLVDCYIGNPTVMLRKNIILNYQFLTQYEPMEDYELWSRLLFITKFYNIQEVLLNYRWHDTNISHAKKVNLNEIHLKIRTNQLSKNFNVNDNFINHLASLNFTERQSPENCVQIIECGKNLTSKNKIYQNYNQDVLENEVKKNILRTIKKAKSYNFAFYKYLLSSDYFKHLYFLDKIKIFFKSILFIKNKT